MDPGRLKYMINQIARNFEAMGRDEAVAATCDHIGKFWDPRMKAAILGGDRSGLSAIAAAAIESLASTLPPAD